MSPIILIQLQVAIVLLALAAVAAADSYKSYGKQHVDYSHVPYYNFDWAVQDEYYNDYGQKETRNGDNTDTQWWVTLPGKGSHIKRSDQIHAQQRHSYGADYKTNDYKKY